MTHTLSCGIQPAHSRVITRPKCSINEVHMDITVKKATDTERSEMQSNPIWECDVSEFDWYYDAEETCLLIEGEVTVSHDRGNISFSAGDYVVFPKGLSCVWKVTKPVKKHYIFRD